MSSIQQHRGRITYERLSTSLERLHGAIAAQLPDLNDAGRVRDLQQVITNALVAARAGVRGEHVASPAQLKQEAKTRIAEIHARHDAVVVDEKAMRSQRTPHISALAPPAARVTHNASLAAPQQPPAPKRPRGTRERSKENAVPAVTLSSQHPPRKLSAVRKTPIANRSTRSNSSAPSRATKHTKRTTAPPPQTDEADRRAAAVALLGLAEHSAGTGRSLASSLSGTTPSSAGKKRAFPVYEDTSPRHDGLAGGDVGSVEKSVLEQSEYAPLPVLHEGVSVQRAFVMGVEYAVRYLEGSGGVGMRDWVEARVGLRSEVRGDGRLGIGGGKADGGGAADSIRAGDGVGRRFWDVV